MENCFFKYIIQRKIDISDHKSFYDITEFYVKGAFFPYTHIRFNKFINNLLNFRRAIILG